MLFVGLKVNQTLQVLKVSHNPIPSSAALQILQAIKANSNSDIRDLRMHNIMVTYEFGIVYLRMLQDHPELTVCHGGYIRSDNSNAFRYVS